MTSPAGDPGRFRLLATFIAGRHVDVTAATEGDLAHTNGSVIFVSSGVVGDQQRREVVLHSALLGAGSLKPDVVKPLRARPALARRYLAVEGRRVLADLAGALPVAADALPVDSPTSTSPEHSLRIAKSHARIPVPPAWFGAIRPSRLTSTSVADGPRATDADLRVHFTVVHESGSEDDEESAERSRILALFETPIVMSQTMATLLRRLLGTGRSPGGDDAGTPLQLPSIGRTRDGSPTARPLPTPIRFTADVPGATLGVGGALHPEWDDTEHRYRPDWCRVIDFPAAAPTDASAASAAVTRDDVLRHRLSRIALAPRVLRRRPDGDELDIDALVDMFIDLRSGSSPQEHVYVERRKVDRNLGVLVLLDASGSVTDTDPQGLAVHEHQCRAAATIVATLEELGDRVALYAFRSHGRHAVQLPAIKTFEQRFGAARRAGLNHLRPSGYTRLGASIRGAGRLLRTQAGTTHQLLVVLSDGFPYDDGYEGRYAEADAARALDELRSDGVACLCLSLGGAPEAELLRRVFGNVGHASAATLQELSPRMDELFTSALAELSAPAARGCAAR